MALSEDDKRWLESKFTAVDSRFTAIDSQVAAIDSQVAAIDSQVAAVDSKVAAVDLRFAAVDSRFAAIDSQFAAVHENFVAIEKKFAPLATREDVFDSETRLLTEFHKWASPMEKRNRGFLHLLDSMSEEIESLKSRMNNLEGRKSA
jgi:chromosome segregation ATPase